MNEGYNLNLMENDITALLDEVERTLLKTSKDHIIEDLRQRGK